MAITAVPLVSVIVVTHNSGGVIGDLLASYGDSRGNLELIVVDCGSTDDTVARLVASPIPKKILVGPNVGYAAGLNRGIAARSPSSVACMVLNPDTTLTPTTILELLETLIEYPQYGALSPTLLNGQGDVTYSGGTFESRSFAVQFSEEHPSALTPQTTEVIHGAAVLIRNAALEDVGPLPEEYFLFREEAALSMRLHDKKWSVGYVPRPTVTHVNGASLNQYSYRVRNFYMTRNHLHFLVDAKQLSKREALKRSARLLYERQRMPGASAVRTLYRLLKNDAAPVCHFILGKKGPRSPLWARDEAIAPVPDHRELALHGMRE